MFHKRMIAVMASMLSTLIFMSLAPAGAVSEPDTAAYHRCEKACLACARACNACNKHCAAMAKSGDKMHAASAALSADCLEVCNVTAAIVARKGPLSAVMSESCVKACDLCGSECGKSMDMAPMAACKKSCDECSAACKALLSSF